MEGCYKYKILSFKILFPGIFIDSRGSYVETYCGPLPLGWNWAGRGGTGGIRRCCTGSSSSTSSVPSAIDESSSLISEGALDPDTSSSSSSMSSAAR